IIETLATKVMGWEMVESEVSGKPQWFYQPEKQFCLEITDWNPLQNIVDAWMLIEKLRNGCWYVQIDSNDGQIDRVHIRTSVVHLEHPREEIAFHKGICGAICKAALKTVT
ncbi:BC1872 family protein, partial [Brevibacillus borstelensis]|uniref:BC1872 family protein n=1 Tax=Brevibacillus borstelensis TaxID=45462 RepID=UPI0030C1EE31